MILRFHPAGCRNRRWAQGHAADDGRTGREAGRPGPGGPGGLPARQAVAGAAVASLVAKKRNAMLECMRNQREIDSD